MGETHWDDDSLTDEKWFIDLLQVPLLLGLFYCTVGISQLYLDERTSSNVIPEESLKKTAVSLMSVILNTMHDQTDILGSGIKYTNTILFLPSFSV